MTTRRIAASGGTDRLPPNGNTPLTTKGDLYTYSTTQARLAVGNDGETLVAISANSTGLGWQGNFAAGKNKIINGDFGIWQRGTSFSITSGTYTADRFNSSRDGNGTVTVSQQSFTAGSAPVSGYESPFFLQIATSSVGTSTYNLTVQNIEDVRTFAGQTVTVSFWAKLSSGTVGSTYFRLNQNFGSGGSAQVTGSSNLFTPTGSWARYSATVSLASISGKTIGTSSFLQFELVIPFTAANTVQIWGVQVEAGSVATAFQTATGTLAGELAACQRYYWRFNSNGTSASVIGQIGIAYNTTDISAVFKCPVTMRTTPTSLDYSNVAVLDVAASRSNITSVTILDSAPDNVRATLVGSGFTAQRSYLIYNQSGAAGYIGYSAEL